MLYVKPLPDPVQHNYQFNALELILWDLTHWSLGDLNKIFGQVIFKIILVIEG